MIEHKHRGTRYWSENKTLFERVSFFNEDVSFKDREKVD